MEITTPLREKDLLKLKAGDKVSLTGEIITLRDATHKRIIEYLRDEKEPPFDFKGKVVYYCGPTPAPPGRVIGACGPTTSARMDMYTLPLLNLGIKGMIGKGKRNQAVKDACVAYDGIYFGATGGAGALLGKQITSAEVIAYPELGPEAVRKITVKDFPVTVVNDTKGNDIYQIGRAQYEVKD